MSTQENGVTGKVVVITGASSGIGEATARMLARHGARLVVGARRIERLAALVSEIRAAGGTAEYQANVFSLAGHRVLPTAAVYSGTKYAVRAISEGLRQEVAPDIRVTLISPGAVESELAETITDAETRRMVDEFRSVAIPADAIARAILFAIEQPDNVSVSEMIVRPTAER